MNDFFGSLTMDIESGKCHVFEQGFQKRESIYCSNNAFEALKYIINRNSKFIISDVANIWIEMESHEDLVIGMRQKPYLFGLCA